MKQAAVPVTMALALVLALAFTVSATPVDYHLYPVVRANDTKTNATTANATKPDAKNTTTNTTKKNTTTTTTSSSAPCFPAFAQVRIGYKYAPIHTLKEGDIVAVGNGRSSPVFLITHRDHHIQYEFVELTTEAGPKITATKGHYIPVGPNALLVAAGEIKVGDLLTLENGATSPVVDIKSMYSNGLYSPNTVHGDIVVDGIVASTYTTAADARFSHAALLPLRAAFDRFGMYAKWNNYWADVARHTLKVYGDKIAF